MVDAALTRVVTRVPAQSLRVRAPGPALLGASERIAWIERVGLVQRARRAGVAIDAERAGNDATRERANGASHGRRDAAALERCIAQLRRRREHSIERRRSQWRTERRRARTRGWFERPFRELEAAPRPGAARAGGRGGRAARRRGRAE